MKKVMTTALALCLALTAVGCGKEKTPAGTGENKVTYWAFFSTQVSAGVDSMAQLPPYQKLMEDTGVEIEFIHPVMGQEKEKFNLMLASRDYPDILQYEFYQYKGGAQQAIDDGVIISMNDIMASNAPNLKKYLDANPKIDRMVKTDQGNYYTFPSLYGDPYLEVFSGLIMRQDYLDKIGEARPETIDEWHTVLSKFQSQLGLGSPLSLSTENLYAFAQAYGSVPTLYVDGDRVKYGVLDDGYRQTLETMAQWYREGLLDNNIASIDAKAITQNIVSGNSGAAFGNTGGGIGSWTNSLKDTPGAKLVPVKYPVLNKGDRPFYGHRINSYNISGSASITTQCKNIEAAAKVLDYGYSDQGRMVFNFGIEGESYEMIDGYPTYTELMTNNPNGKSFSDMLGFYAAPNGTVPTIKDRRYMEQFSALPAQKQSLEIWSETDAEQHLLPPVYLTAEESTEVAAIKTDLESYVDTMTLKFITGIEPMSNYDTFLAEVKKLKADRYAEIYNQAYERYMNK